MSPGKVKCISQYGFRRVSYEVKIAWSQYLPVFFSHRQHVTSNLRRPALFMLLKLRNIFITITWNIVSFDISLHSPVIFTLIITSLSYFLVFFLFTSSCKPLKSSPIHQTQYIIDQSYCIPFELLQQTTLVIPKHQCSTLTRVIRNDEERKKSNKNEK